MALKIISGLARGITLDTPPDRSMRPTAGRAREALFSSLNIQPGQSFMDVFAGSGAIGLEAASRGAGMVTLVEAEPRHIRIIQRNIEKLRKAGVDIPIEVIGRRAAAGTLKSLPAADIIFFDPPYADSGRYFGEIFSDAGWLERCKDSLIVWELPDSTEDMKKFEEVLPRVSGLAYNIRKLGSVDFLFGKVKE